MTLSVKDLENLQSLFSEQHLDYQMELADGKITLMGPSDVYASEVGARLIRFLGNWADPRRLGRVFDSSGGFVLPTAKNNRSADPSASSGQSVHGGSLKAPDVSFVLAARLRQSPRYFAQMLPDLTVEIKSQSDRIPLLEEKILQFLALGTQVGMLIDPDKETVTIYRNNQPNVDTEASAMLSPSPCRSVVLGNEDTIEIPELLPGWSVPVSELWPPVFD